MGKVQKKIAILHRYPKNRICETNAAFPYLARPGVDVLTFRKFDRLSQHQKFWKSIAWIFYAPMLVIGRGYDVIYCDDSFPFYPILVKLVSWKSRVVLRLGDLHLMYYTSGWLYRFLHFFEKIGWRLASDILVISDAMASYMLTEGFITEVVPDPVDPDDFPSRGAYECGTVMFHGLLTKNKNVDILLECAELLPEVDFTIIGDGPDRKRLQAKAPSNVHFFGWVPFKDMHSHIKYCSVGVALRSNNPGNEYVVTSPFLQYGVMGKPCLVTRRKVYGDYKWQFSTAEEMASKINELSKNSCYEGHKLRKIILDQHDAKKIGERIWSLLQS